MRLFASISNLAEGSDLLRQRRFGVIIAREGRLERVRFRPLPKVISIPEFGFFGSWHHRYSRKDECRLYYNQPWGHSSFLSLRYVESAVGTSLATVNVALTALVEIARVKRSDALLCDAGNVRLSDRVMKRYGWEPHKPQRWHRNFIRRFYGEYPTLTANMRSILYGESEERGWVSGLAAAHLDAREDAAPSEEDLLFDHHDDLVLSPQLRRHIAANTQHKASC